METSDFTYCLWSGSLLYDTNLVSVDMDTFGIDHEVHKHGTLSHEVALI